MLDSKIKPIGDEFPGYYISSEGNVLSDRSGKRTKLTPSLRNGRYLAVSLYSRKGDKKTRSIHVLVAEAFIGERPEGLQIRHLNGDKKDNRVENLAYGTAEENYEDRRKHGICNTGSRHGKTDLTEQDILEIRKRFAGGEDRDALKAEFKLTTASLSKIVLGKTWTHVDGPIMENRRKGVFLHNAKLNDKKVKEIREFYSAGEYSQSDLADLYGCSQRNIGKIVRRETWRHVE